MHKTHTNKHNDDYVNYRRVSNQIDLDLQNNEYVELFLPVDIISHISLCLPYPSSIYILVIYPFSITSH